MVFAVVKNDGVGKRRPKQNATEKHSEERKGTKTQNITDERRITGRFAKRFSGERPVLLGFEFTFLSEFSEFVWRVLVYVKHPPKCQIYFDYVVCLTFIDVFDITLIWIGLITTDLP